MGIEGRTGSSSTMVGSGKPNDIGGGTAFVTEEKDIDALLERVEERADELGVVEPREEDLVLLTDAVPFLCDFEDFPGKIGVLLGDKGGDFGGVSGRADLIECGDTIMPGVGSLGTETVIKVSTSLELTTFSRAIWEWSENTLESVMELMTVASVMESSRLLPL